MDMFMIYGNYDVITCKHCSNSYRRLESHGDEQTRLRLRQQRIPYKDICPFCEHVNSSAENMIYMNIPLETVEKEECCCV